MRSSRHRKIRRAKKDIEKNETKRQKARRERIAKGQRLRKKLLSAIDDVVEAMGSKEFVEDRPPERLSADIAATALLLKKAYADEILGEADFSKSHWRSLERLVLRHQGRE